MALVHRRQIGDERLEPALIFQAAFRSSKWFSIPSDYTEEAGF
jgi:hypothetical protein